MREAEARAIAAGIPSRMLMEAAGRAVADAAIATWGRGFYPVICGRGNNGGDALVAARALAEAGCRTCVFPVAPPEAYSGDAAWALSLYRGPVASCGEAIPEQGTAIIDGLLGTGFRGVPGDDLAGIIRRTGESRLPVLSVDIPSGVCADSGEVPGEAIQAGLTVTFFRHKPGHFLYPGRGRCGRIVLSRIGMDDSCLPGTATGVLASHPRMWPEAYAPPAPGDHKYRRGSVLVVTGGIGRTGAARLAAIAALRGGAGLATLVCPAESVPECAAGTLAVMVAGFSGEAGFRRLLGERRFDSLVIGPGAGTGPDVRERVACALAAGRPLVLDADVHTAFRECPDDLFRAIRQCGQEVVLTPHDGEFRRLFPDIRGNRLVRAREAARRSGAVVVLKGADSVVATPAGLATINSNAPADLATAGAGDVLAGHIAALLARGLPGLKAAAAAVWIQGEAAGRLGPGLISEDLPSLMPAVLKTLRQEGET